MSFTMRYYYYKIIINYKKSCGHEDLIRKRSKIQKNLIVMGCGCKGMCYIKLSQKYLDNVRDDMTELCKDEFDVIVM